MATLEHESSPPLPPAIRQQLAALRAGIRRYIWFEGLAAVAVWTGAAFWGSMAIDWIFEPRRPVRVALLAAAGIGLVVVLFLFILRRAFVRLSDSNMATILERQFPQLNDSLLTSVSLLDCPIERSGFNPEMLALTSHLAQQRLEKVPLSQVFNPMPLVRKVVIALGLALTIGLLAVMAPSVLNLWTERNLLLSNTMWPRKIRLEAVGFTDGVAKVAAGANFDLRVQAFRGDTEIPVIPEKVEIRYRVEGGGRDRKTMKNIGQPVTSSAATDQALQEYSYPFTGVLSSIRLDIAGGDARLYDLQLKVVPNPNLNLKLVCEYPPYMERNPLTIDSVSPTVPVRVPIGSRVTIRGVADKPLETARIDCPAAESNADWHRQFRGDELGAERNEFTYAFEPFPAPTAKEMNAAASADGKGARNKVVGETDPAAKLPHEVALQFTLRDTDGLKTRDPLALTLVAVPDEPPEVKVRLVGTREPVVTPKGRLPVTGTISDDHGLGRAWFDYSVEERAAAAVPKTPLGDSSQKPREPPKTAPQRSGEVPLAELPKHLAEYVIKEADVKASQLSLTTGQRLTLAVRAADLCTFGNGPNIGSGETWQLDVVSEDELVTRLEAQELLVKQRFEAIVEEMAETRNLLLKMDFTPPEKAIAVAPRAKQAGAEPGEHPDETPRFSADELNKRRLERTLQALQNCRKNASETADVTAAIEEIRLQLDNNQANTEARKERIEKQVLQPLHDIVDHMFPILEQRLVALQAVVDNLSDGPKRRDAAQEQADQILAKMLEVLDHMMKTEDFNINVVQRLKKIIVRQKELTQRTEKTEQESLGEKE
ncbi:MAG: hypothetical protein ACLP9L_08440 [Thermoguttaceae bacterium]